MPAYRAMPDKGGPFPVVLVVQEIFGVHEHIKDLCRRFAKAGYLAVAPELYARQGDVSKIDRHHRRSSPRWCRRSPTPRSCPTWTRRSPGPRRRARATRRSWASPASAGAGAIVWLYAAHNKDLKAGVAWYGRLVGKPDDLQPKNPIDLVGRLKAPVLGLYGGKDQGISGRVRSRRCDRRSRRPRRRPARSYVYPDAGHGFNADYRPSYNKEAAEDGWKRMLDWFKKNGVA